MSESLSWMQTGDTLALSGELDQDVLLPLWEMREEAVKGLPASILAVSPAWIRGTGTAAPSYRSGEKAGQQCDASGVNDKVYTLAKLYNLPADVLPR